MFVKENCNCSIDSVVFTIVLFCRVTICNLLDRYQHFEGTCSLHLQVIKLFLSRGGGRRFLQNIGSDLPNMLPHLNAHYLQSLKSVYLTVTHQVCETVNCCNIRPRNLKIISKSIIKVNLVLNLFCLDPNKGLCWSDKAIIYVHLASVYAASLKV